MPKIKIYDAKDGDAFLVEGTSSNFSALIDGGYKSTFSSSIRPDLEYLAKQGRVLDLVVCTHVDADHISGLLSFFEKNESSMHPKIIAVGEVFHNGLSCLLLEPTDSTRLSNSDAVLLRDIKLRGFPKNEVSIKGENISARQGLTLSGLLTTNDYFWNRSDGKSPIIHKSDDHMEIQDAKIFILAPNRKRLDQLKSWWISELRQLGYFGTLSGLDDVFELICAYETQISAMKDIAQIDGNLRDVYTPDKSVTNGSSISFILELEGKRILFLGDSFAEDIVEVLPEKPQYFDAIKISHHGGLGNTSPELLSVIDSPNYLISTSGDKHDHPSIPVLKEIVDRPSKFTRNVFFNYSTKTSDYIKSYIDNNSRNCRVFDGFQEWIHI